jgi:uncharacterized protein YkwD
MSHRSKRLAAAVLPLVAGAAVTAVLAVPVTATASPTSPTPTTAATSAATGYTTRADWATAVLTRLNSERAAAGLPALTSNARLVSSAHSHNAKMASANTLSHQLPGEAGLGARITATGYSWSTVGENVAYNSVRTQAGVIALQDAMYRETAPNDGHRRNILSTAFTQVGVDVIDDSVHGRVWLVTDFGRPR